MNDYYNHRRIDFLIRFYQETKDNIDINQNVIHNLDLLRASKKLDEKQKKLFDLAITCPNKKEAAKRLGVSYSIYQTSYRQLLDTLCKYMNYSG